MEVRWKATATSTPKLRSSRSSMELMSRWHSALRGAVPGFFAATRQIICARRLKALNKTFREKKGCGLVVLVDEHVAVHLVDQDVVPDVGVRAV